MTIDSVSALTFLPFVLPVAIWVAWSDLRFMKITNRAVLVLFGIFVLVGPFALPLDDYLARYLHVAVVLAVGFVLTIAGVMGAGDAKFLAAMAPFFDPADLLAVAQLFGVTLLVAVATHRGFRAVPAVRAAVPCWESWQRSDFPMGLALASVLLFYLGLGAVSAS